MAKVKAIKPEKIIKALTAELEREKARASKWKARTKDLESEISKAAKKIRKLEKSLIVEAPVVIAVEETVASETAPDVTWTVAELRAVAKERQIPAYYRKSKAELLAALAE